MHSFQHRSKWIYPDLSSMSKHVHDVTQSTEGGVDAVDFSRGVWGPQAQVVEVHPLWSVVVTQTHRGVERIHLDTRETVGNLPSMILETFCFR